jgi:hypothetical protein
VITPELFQSLRIEVDGGFEVFLGIYAGEMFGQQQDVVSALPE